MSKKPKPTLRDLVFEALDNADENGFGLEARMGPIVDVATDLMDRDACIFDAVKRHTELIPHIEAWRNK